MFDPWQLVRSLQRQYLATVVFLIAFIVPVGAFTWLAPDLLGPSLLPIVLLSGVAAYASWRWSRDHL